MGVRDFLKKAVKKAVRRDSSGTSRSTGQARSGPLPTGAVAWSARITDTKSAEVVVDGIGVAVFRVDGELFALDNACTHEDGPLGEGRVEGGVVTCPYHDWRFDIRSGECLSHANRSVSCWAVEERDGAVYVTGRTTEGATERGGAHDDGLAVITKNLDEE